MFIHHILWLIIFTLSLATLVIFGLTELYYSSLFLINPAILNKLLFKIGRIIYYNISFREYVLLYTSNRE